MMRLLCRIFGHKRSVVWQMQNLTGEYCTRCKSWTAIRPKNPLSEGEL